MGILKTLFYAFLIYYGWRLLKIMFFTPSKINQESPKEFDGKDNKKDQKLNGESEYIDYEEVK
jgi:hypothetical protein